VRAMILGGNLAGLHGIDIAAQRNKIENDSFAQEKAANGVRTAWASIGEAA